MTLSVEARLTRTGRALRLVQGDKVLSAGGDRDTALVKLIVKARRWWEILARGETDIKTLSQAEGVTASYMTRVVRLAFLAPAVADAALGDSLSAGVDSTALLETGAIRADWRDQTRMFVTGGSG